MSDLKNPCDGCPFRRANASVFSFTAARLEQIRAAPAFQCHRTLRGRPQQCAGLMATLHRDGEPNQIMQVAERLGALNPEEIDGDGVAYATWGEACAALRERP